MSCTRPLLLAITIAAMWLIMLSMTVLPGHAAIGPIELDAPTKNANGTP